MKNVLEQEVLTLEQLVDYTEQLRQEEIKRQEKLKELIILKNKMEKDIVEIANKVKIVQTINPLIDDNNIHNSVDDLILHNKTAQLQYLEEQVRQYDVSIQYMEKVIIEKKSELLHIKQSLLLKEENK